jgi:hypothetical protein
VNDLLAGQIDMVSPITAVLQHIRLANQAWA